MKKRQHADGGIVVAQLHGFLIDSICEATLSCVNITPFGSPVEPEVNMTVSRSSGDIADGPSCRSSMPMESFDCDEGGKFIGQGYSVAKIIEIDQFGIRLSLIFPLPAAGEHMSDAAFGDAMVHHCRGQWCNSDLRQSDS